MYYRAIPALVWHRQNWEVLYPLEHLAADELADLRNSTSYVAGFTDAMVEGRTDLYDVFVNLAASEIAVAPHAKGSNQFFVHTLRLLCL